MLTQDHGGGFSFGIANTQVRSCCHLIVLVRRLGGSPFHPDQFVHADLTDLTGAKISLVVPDDWARRHARSPARPNPEAFAHMAIDAGASLVIASGPHVLRGMQFYKGHLIAYSLGNFAGYGNFTTSGDLGISVILHVTLSATGRFESARLYPIEFAGAGRPVPGGAGVAFIAQLGSADFGPTAARISSSGVITPP
ncbi:MAG: CapA family protein [Streptosporangiaceae bacterium]